MTGIPIGNVQRATCNVQLSTFNFQLGGGKEGWLAGYGDRHGVHDSNLRPDSSGWYTRRGNNRRTAQWSHPAPPKSCFNSVSKAEDNQLNLWLSLPVGTTNQLQITTDWQLWTTVVELVGLGGPTNVVVPIQPTESMAVFHLQTVPNP